MTLDLFCRCVWLFPGFREIPNMASDGAYRQSRRSSDLVQGDSLASQNGEIFQAFSRPLAHGAFATAFIDVSADFCGFDPNPLTVSTNIRLETGECGEDLRHEPTGSLREIDAFGEGDELDLVIDEVAKLFMEIQGRSTQAIELPHDDLLDFAAVDSRPQLFQGGTCARLSREMIGEPNDGSLLRLHPFLQLGDLTRGVLLLRGDADIDGDALGEGLGDGLGAFHRRLRSVSSWVYL